MLTDMKTQVMIREKKIKGMLKNITNINLTKTALFC